MVADSSQSVNGMLTTLINLIDKEKSKKYNIQDFVNKPLSIDLLRSIT